MKIVIFSLILVPQWRLEHQQALCVMLYIMLLQCTESNCFFYTTDAGGVIGLHKF